MGEVHSLSGDKIEPFEADANAVATLERFLEQARSGEVVGVVVAAQHRDGLASWTRGGRIGSYSLVGALSIALGWVHNSHTLENADG